MASLNRVQIIGNLGKEPEMRFTPTGKAVTNFNVAVNEKHGENEKVEWFSIVAWEKLAESCNKYLTKGQQVYIEGRFETSKYTGDDGMTKYRTNVVALKVLFLGRRNGEKTEVDNSEDNPF